MITNVILSRAKDLGDSTTDNNSTAVNSHREILHCVQNDKEESLLILSVIPRRGNREAVGSTLLLCPDVGIYRCLWASHSERARVSTRLQEQWLIATELHRASIVTLRPRDAIPRNDDTLYVILSETKDLWDSMTANDSTTATPTERFFTAFRMTKEGI